MNPSRVGILAARRWRSVGVRGCVGRRWESGYQPPRQEIGEDQSKGRVKAFYTSFTSPFLKVFLGALFTYQLLYWGWLKLESLEVKEEKEEEIKRLEGQLRALTKRDESRKRD